MKKPKIAAQIAKKLKSITGKRSLVVINHILQHGHITTEDLERYGYKHPPRAIRDVREQGLPLDQFWTKNSQGRKIAGYRFGDPSAVRNDRLGGRKVFSRDFEKKVIADHEGKCTICQAHLIDRHLQIDHRIPYEVAGDTASKDRRSSDYMSLCVSCNRAKSWSCEHCINCKQTHNPKLCLTCYWGSPEHYTHIACHDIRRLDLTWQGNEITEYDKISRIARQLDQSMPEYVKAVLRTSLKQT